MTWFLSTRSLLVIVRMIMLVAFIFQVKKRKPAVMADVLTLCSCLPSTRKLLLQRNGTNCSSLPCDSSLPVSNTFARAPISYSLCESLVSHLISHCIQPCTKLSGKANGITEVHFSQLTPVGHLLCPLLKPRPSEGRQGCEYLIGWILCAPEHWHSTAHSVKSW